MLVLKSDFKQVTSVCKTNICQGVMTGVKEC